MLGKSCVLQIQRYHCLLWCHKSINPMGERSFSSCNDFCKIEQFFFRRSRFESVLPRTSTREWNRCDWCSDWIFHIILHRNVCEPLFSSTLNYYFRFVIHGVGRRCTDVVRQRKFFSHFHILVRDVSNVSIADAHQQIKVVINANRVAVVGVNIQGLFSIIELIRAPVCGCEYSCSSHTKKRRKRKHKQNK